MSGPVEVGQVWRTPKGTVIRIKSIDADDVTYTHQSEDHTWDWHMPMHVLVPQLSERADLPPNPTIKLRIRVGVTADGEYLAAGSNDPTRSEKADISDDIADAMGRAIVAWHWITAEVPMPETEHGDVVGEVERSCAGMPSDQKDVP